MQAWIAFLAVLFLPLAGCTDSEGLHAAPAPGRIDGGVVDQHMQPFSNATVRLLELGRADTTSQYGGFTFASVPPGTYRLQVDPPDATSTAEEVVVRAGETTRTILQPMRQMAPPIYKAELQKRSDGLAVPGAACEECAWETHLAADVQDLVVRAEWKDPLDGSLVLRLTDRTGTLLAQARGTSPLWASADVDDMQGSRLHVGVTYGPDVVPQAGYEVLTFLDVYYGERRSA